jgi:hypothetical protein
VCCNDLYCPTGKFLYAFIEINLSNCNTFDYIFLKTIVEK